MNSRQQEHKVRFADCFLVLVREGGREWAEPGLRLSQDEMARASSGRARMVPRSLRSRLPVVVAAGSPALGDRWCIHASARDLPEVARIRAHPLNRRPMPRRISPVRFAAIPLAAMIAACAQPSPVQTSPSPTPAPAGPVKPVRAGHPGFDTNVYPGDAMMRAWRDASPYEWVGYYLPAPCHRDASWAGKREALIGMGW